MYLFLKKKIFKIIILIFGVLLLSGCHDSVFHPSGQISIKQYQLIYISFLTMLIVVIPVIVMTILFSYKYRDSNKNNNYLPNWSHSNIIELFVWIIPILIIFFLGIISWKSTHELDPNKSIISNNKPIVINVVALDWKWLFIYPQNNIATINEIVLPPNTPVIFNITSNSVMSSFFIPELGSQIYAMPGMETHLNLISVFPGKYNGLSANYNGIGFSNMKFSAIVTSNDNVFYSWVKQVKNVSNKLNTISQFKEISKPNEFHGIKYFSYVFPKLFNMIIHQSI